MVCRVGMATDPQERIARWKKKEGHTYSKILHSNLLYKRGVRAGRGGSSKAGLSPARWWPQSSGRVWSVYYLSGGK